MSDPRIIPTRNKKLPVNWTTLKKYALYYITVEFVLTVRHARYIICDALLNLLKCINRKIISRIYYGNTNLFNNYRQNKLIQFEI